MSDPAAGPARLARGGLQDIPRPSEFVGGDPAPWAHLPPEGRRLDLDALLRSVADRGPGRLWLRDGTAPPAPDVRRSAVLVPLYDAGAGPVVVLTKRAAGLRFQPGHIAFPGGRIDPGETPVQAALREAHEETGLEPDQPVVVGELDHVVTVATGAPIVPVVARLEGRPKLVPSEAEVATILHVPLAELTDDECYREERWDSGPTPRSIWFFELEGETVWGVTAAILRQLVQVGLALPG